jgi:hypothetical protein
MDTSTKQSTFRVTVVVILLISVFIGVSFFLTYLFPIYISQACFAIVAITVAIALSVHQKHISLNTILLVICSLLFLAGSVIGYANETAIRSLPVSAQIEFMRVIRPSQISQGLWNAGIGLAFFLLAFFALRMPNKKTPKWFIFLMFGVGILVFVLGIFSVFNGFSRL